MRTVALFAATALVAAAPAAARNPVAALAIAPSPRAGQATLPAAPGTAARSDLPVPGYKFIAAGILLGIGGIIFAFTQQDGTPDSN